ncbi:MULTISPECIES: polymer-forming cytoskeletal protein [unclassified Anaeromyxobacter]|uniref:bactofilin family protein n=1 Tax=unclassified Anaeromyxobacter TaxID=2620896 RepID=UPI001F5AFE4D|nr:MULTISPECIES: polymer-forming cytoskeletal protein [unclassified Anaeromyxobacter]
MATIDGSTIIGESILISGSLNGDEDLTVRGRVEGTLTLTKTLVVEPTGVVKAEVQVKNCIISGAIVGNVTATESVEITREGRMVGDISAPRVIIVDGASFRGRIDMGEVDVEAERETRTVVSRPAPLPSRPALRPAPRPVPIERKMEEKTVAVAAPKPPAPPAPVAMGAVKRKVIVKRK